MSDVKVIPIEVIAIVMVIVMVVMMEVGMMVCLW